MLLTASPLADLAARMRGRVVGPEDPDWHATRRVFNLTTDVRPAAVALPRDTSDAAAAVRHAAEHGLRVAPQATGHNAAAHGSLEGTLLVDVRELREVAIDAATRRVRVGAGVRWGRVIPPLSELGLAALHGSSPLVGIAGYSLGGGMGWLARRHGLQANSVTAIELVTADGRAARVDAEHEPDLFWALRGGNGNFGVVTAIEFAVHPVEELYAGVMLFPLERAGEVLHAWTSIAPALPDEMMTWASLLRFPELPSVPEPLRGGAFTVVSGAFLGDEPAGRSLLRVVRDLRPLMDSFAMVPPLALADMAMDPPAPLPYLSATALLDDLPGDAVDALVAAAGAGSGSSLAMVQMRQLGGALARRTPAAGARATLPGAYSMLALGIPAGAISTADVGSDLDAVARAVRPHRAGDYPNFVERPSDASAFFDPQTWARLRRVKRRYDPGDLFRGNHRIPPAA